MTPISSDKRRKKKTIGEILRGLLFAMIPTLMIAVVGYYGYIQNNSGTNSEKINNFNIRLNKYGNERDKENEKLAIWKTEFGTVINEMNNKLDTVMKGQKKQRQFDIRLINGNKKLLRSFEDIFGTKRSVDNNK